MDFFSWPALEIPFLGPRETHSGTLTLDCGSGCTYKKSQLGNLTPNIEGRALAWAEQMQFKKEPFNLWVEELLLSQLLLPHLEDSFSNAAQDFFFLFFFFFMGTDAAEKLVEERDLSVAFGVIKSTKP